MENREGIPGKLKLLMALLTICAGLLGYYVTWSIGRSDILQKELQSQKSDAMAIIREDIAEQKTLAKAIAKKVISIRTINDSLRSDCGKPDWNLQAAYEKRYAADVDLAIEITGSYITFNHEIFEKIHSYLVYDQSVKDLCAKDAPTDDEWYKRQKEIFYLIHELIDQENFVILQIIESKDLAYINKMLIEYMVLHDSSQRKQK